jgi:hypothetical protein
VLKRPFCPSQLLLPLICSCVPCSSRIEVSRGLVLLSFVGPIEHNVTVDLDPDRARQIAAGLTKCAELAEAKSNED